jgi:ArsR family transcriptional regulator
MSMRGWKSGGAESLRIDDPPARGRPRGRALAGAELSSVAATFRALSDPTRLRLLALLGDGERCVHELCAALRMSQPAVSHQLRLLRVGRLVRSRRAGREVYYALDDEHVMELVAQARSHALESRRARPAARDAR